MGRGDIARQMAAVPVEPKPAEPSHAAAVVAVAHQPEPAVTSQPEPAKRPAPANPLIATFGAPSVASMPRLVEYPKKKYGTQDVIKGQYQMPIARLSWRIGATSISASVNRDREEIEVEGRKAWRNTLRVGLPAGVKYDFRDETAVAQVREFTAMCLDTFRAWAKTHAPDLIDLRRMPEKASTAKRVSGGLKVGQSPEEEIVFDDDPKAPAAGQTPVAGQ